MSEEVQAMVDRVTLVESEACSKQTQMVRSHTPQGTVSSSPAGALLQCLKCSKDWFGNLCLQVNDNQNSSQHSLATLFLLDVSVVCLLLPKRGTGRGARTCGTPPSSPFLLVDSLP